MKKQVAHIGIGFAALAAFAALVLTGCVPGEAQIKVKSSELAKMANGEIGWADVTIVASNVLSERHDGHLSGAGTESQAAQGVCAAGVWRVFGNEQAFRRPGFHGGGTERRASLLFLQG